jgi:sterol 3beta-glucosyltransferase
MSAPIVMLALGTRADVAPSIAIGNELRMRGNDVRVLTSDRQVDLVTAAGLEHVPIGVDPEQILQGLIGDGILTATDPKAALRMVTQTLNPTVEQLLVQVQAAAIDAKAFLGPSFGLVGYHLRERYRIPCAFLQINPEEPTRSFPSPVLPGRRSLGGLANRASHTLVDQVSWQVLRPLINAWRTESLGLPQIPRSSQRRHAMPVLCGFSEAVVPRPRDWPDHVHVTGYWYRDHAESWQPPQPLSDFLAAGSPPIYVAPLVARDPVEVTAIVREALHRAGVRGLVHDDPIVEDAPAEWLFPRCAAVIQQGGSGTTGAALRAGVPTVVCPVVGEQWFWAERVASIGVGPRPVPVAKFTVDALADAIRRAMTDQHMRTTVAALGRRLRAENGVDRACDLIEGQLDTSLDSCTKEETRS